MAGKFKYSKKVKTTISKGPRKGQSYVRYYYPGGLKKGTIAANVLKRRTAHVKKLEVQRDKLMVDVNRTGSRKSVRKLKSIRTKIKRLNELTRLAVF